MRGPSQCRCRHGQWRGHHWHDLARRRAPSWSSPFSFSWLLPCSPGIPSPPRPLPSVAPATTPLYSAACSLADALLGQLTVGPLASTSTPPCLSAATAFPSSSTCPRYTDDAVTVEHRTRLSRRAVPIVVPPPPEPYKRSPEPSSRAHSLSSPPGTPLPF